MEQGAKRLGHAAIQIILVVAGLIAFAWYWETPLPAILTQLQLGHTPYPNLTKFVASAILVGLLAFALFGLFKIVQCGSRLGLWACLGKLILYTAIVLFYGSFLCYCVAWLLEEHLR